MLDEEPSLPKPRIGFFGVIDERLDLELLSEMARLRPDWSLVMIGPVVKIDPAELPRGKVTAQALATFKRIVTRQTATVAGATAEAPEPAARQVAHSGLPAAAWPSSRPSSVPTASPPTEAVGDGGGHRRGQWRRCDQRGEVAWIIHRC